MMVFFYPYILFQPVPVDTATYELKRELCKLRPKLKIKHGARVTSRLITSQYTSIILYVVHACKLRGCLLRVGASKFPFSRF